MRVLFLTHHLPWPPLSGGRLREAELLGRLSRCFEIELIAISKLPELDVRFLAHAADQRIDAQVFPAAKSTAAGTSPHVRRHQSDAARRHLARRLANDAATIVHVEGHYLLDLLPAHARKRALVAEHNVESTLYLQRAALAASEHERTRLLEDARLTRRTERKAWTVARALAAVTDDDAGMIRNAVPEADIWVIPDGTDHMARGNTRSGIPDGASLLFVGNLAYQPNEDAARLLVEQIFPAVATRCPRATLAIVGPGAPSWLTSLAERDSRIRVPGWVASLTEWLDAAEVVVCPLRVGGGVKVKVLEALVRGCAVVTTSIGLQGLRHLPANAAIRCDDVDAVIDACVSLLTAPDRRARQRASAARAARLLPSWDQAAYRLAAAWTALATVPHADAAWVEG